MDNLPFKLQDFVMFVYELISIEDILLSLVLIEITTIFVSS